MKTARILMAFAMVLMAASLFAYVPENNEENTFNERVAGPFYEVTELIKDGIKSTRQEIVSSSYDQERKTGLDGEGLAEKESGGEEVTSKEVVYYEPKEEIYEAQEIMEEILIWLTMYRTTHGDDVVTYNKMKKYIKDKDKYLGKLIKALKYEKDNKDSVLKYKQKIKKADKDFKRYAKRLKGKIKLIEGKPLPEPQDDDEDEDEEDED